MTEHYERRIGRLCRKLAHAYLSHLLKDSGRPVAYVNTEDGRRVSITLDVDSTATCIWKGLVIPAERQYLGKVGKSFAIHMLTICFADEEISAEGLDVMKNVLADGVASFYAREKN
ncbi:Uncharacterised protein [Yersinia rohdei]|nr:Uncharacterised protein [Yersinia rohdei]